MGRGARLVGVRDGRVELHGAQRVLGGGGRRGLLDELESVGAAGEEVAHVVGDVGHATEIDDVICAPERGAAGRAVPPTSTPVRAAEAGSELRWKVTRRIGGRGECKATLCQRLHASSSAHGCMETLAAWTSCNLNAAAEDRVATSERP